MTKYQNLTGWRGEKNRKEEKAVPFQAWMIQLWMVPDAKNRGISCPDGERFIGVGLSEVWLSPLLKGYNRRASYIRGVSTPFVCKHAWLTAVRRTCDEDLQAQDFVHAWWKRAIGV